jgi:hypothetical protein
MSKLLGPNKEFKILPQAVSKRPNKDQNISNKLWNLLKCCMFYLDLAKIGLQKVAEKCQKLITLKLVIGLKRKCQ